jgi:hypothetical protein
MVSEAFRFCRARNVWGLEDRLRPIGYCLRESKVCRMFPPQTSSNRILERFSECRSIPQPEHPQRSTSNQSLRDRDAKAPWGCKPKPQKIPRPLDHAYSPSPDDPSVPRVGWRPITVLTASLSFDRSNANQGTHLSDVIRGNLFPTRCYLLMSN